MKIFHYARLQTAVSCLSVGLLAASSLAFAQEMVPPATQSEGQADGTVSSGGWRRVGDPPSDQAADPNQAPQPDAQQPADAQQPYDGPQPAYGPQTPSGQPNYSNQAPNYSNQAPAYSNQPNYGQGAPYNQPPNYSPQAPYQAPVVPAQILLPAGTFVTVRVNQLLSSDRNQPGDAFSATLVDPVVANGVVLAEPGQTLGGRVAEAQKAGRVEGVARLAIELTQMSLVDGQQIPIHSQLVSRKGPTSIGRDAGAIAGTTALGAAIGAAAGWGTGAAIGAGAGLAAGTIGVLLTRGHPSVIYPEQTLTFRLDAPLQISTTNAPEAFHYVQPGEYDRQPNYAPGPNVYASAPAPAAPYYGYGYPYPAYGYGYGYPYWGPSVGFYFGRGYGYYGGYGRGYYGRPYYRGYYRR